MIYRHTLREASATAELRPNLLFVATVERGDGSEESLRLLKELVADLEAEVAQLEALKPTAS